MTKLQFEVLKLLNQRNFTLESVILRNFIECETNMPELIDFFENHCLYLKKLELENCFDTNLNVNSGPFVKIASRTDFYCREPTV